MEREVAGLRYVLTYKKVKNLNLRVHADGSLRVSAPRRVGVREIDRFVAARAGWIEQARRKLRERAAQPPKEPLPQPPDACECLALFLPYVEKWARVLGDALPAFPAVRVRRMKSCWGVCHPRKGYITLNSKLYFLPAEAIDYVVLHELVHFLHPDHQKGFHAQMSRLMPDYQQRRALLRGYE